MVFFGNTNATVTCNFVDNTLTVPIGAVNIKVNTNCDSGITAETFYYNCGSGQTADSTIRGMA